MAEKKITTRRVMAGDREILYQLERKAVKNLNLRVREDGSVYASAPRRVPAAEVDAFVTSRGEFILRAAARMEERQRQKRPPGRALEGERIRVLGEDLTLTLRRGEGPDLFREGDRLVLRARDPEDPAGRQKALEAGLDRLCREVFREILDELYPLAAERGAAKPALRIRRMKSRWGSCLPGKGIVTLNRALLEAPRGCVRYVVLHELCHLIHPDHSGRFYGLLGTWMPDWKRWKTLLEETVVL